jgi:hypothetical protein
LRQQIEIERQRKFQSESFKQKSLKKVALEPLKNEVKLTLASILREEALIQKNKRTQLESLAIAEMGLKDEGDFAKWRENVRSEQEFEKAKRIEEKRLEIQLLHEDAFRAKQEQERVKKQFVTNY